MRKSWLAGLLASMIGLLNVCAAYGADHLPQDQDIPLVLVRLESEAGPKPPAVSNRYQIALALFRGGGVAVLSLVGVHQATQSWEVALPPALISGMMSALLQYYNIPFVQWLVNGELPSVMMNNRIVSGINAVVNRVGRQISKISPVRKADMPFFTRWVAVEVAYLSIASATLEVAKHGFGGVGVESLSTFQSFVVNRLGLPIPAPILGVAENAVMGMLAQGILDNANATHYDHQRSKLFERTKTDPAFSKELYEKEYRKLMLYTDIRTSFISAIAMGFSLANLAGVPYADLSLWIMTGLGVMAKMVVNYKVTPPGDIRRGIGQTLRRMVWGCPTGP